MSHCKPVEISVRINMGTLAFLTGHIFVNCRRFELKTFFIFFKVTLRKRLVGITSFSLYKLPETKKKNYQDRKSHFFFKMSKHTKNPHSNKYLHRCYYRSIIPLLSNRIFSTRYLDKFHLMLPPFFPIEYFLFPCFRL